MAQLGPWLPGTTFGQPGECAWTGLDSVRGPWPRRVRAALPSWVPPPSAQPASPRHLMDEESKCSQGPRCWNGTPCSSKWPQVFSKGGQVALEGGALGAPCCLASERPGAFFPRPACPLLDPAATTCVHLPHGVPCLLVAPASSLNHQPALSVPGLRRALPPPLLEEGPEDLR